jgi:hypothetical protein
MTFGVVVLFDRAATHQRVCIAGIDGERRGVAFAEGRLCCSRRNSRVASMLGLRALRAAS